MAEDLARGLGLAAHDRRLDIVQNHDVHRERPGHPVDACHVDKGNRDDEHGKGRPQRVDHDERQHRF
mgnify:CR=1 FL=1